MAQKKKASKSKAKVSSSSSNVTRVRAVDTEPKTKKTNKPQETKPTKTAEKAVVAEATPAKKRKLKVKPGVALKPAKSLGGYFKGAWIELKQVRWPNRRATWSMTGAVLIYTAFFVILILLLDAGFKALFEIILGS